MAGKREQAIEALAKARAVRKEKGVVRGKDKLTTVIDGLKESYEELGGKDYLVQLGKRHPKIYAGLLGKLIPTKVEADVKASFAAMIAEIEPPTQ